MVHNMYVFKSTLIIETLSNTETGLITTGLRLGALGKSDNYNYNRSLKKLSLLQK